jgi:thiamine pyrophosphate-dependent acetolactate synthase large subunit-like protein
MKRIDAIKEIMQPLTDELVISSAGMISREIFKVCDRPGNFYVMGSMGATIPIGIGVAMNTKKDVIVIAGDGEVLMDLSSLVLAKSLNLSNLTIHVLDNNGYSTTGGQKTISDYVNFKEIGGWCTAVHYVDTEKGVAPRIPLTHTQIKVRFMDAVKR